MPIIKILITLLFLLPLNALAQNKASQANIDKARDEYTLAGQAVNNGDKDKAIRHLLKANILHPGVSRYTGSLANLYFDLEQYENAREYYLKAQSIDVAASNGRHPKIPFYVLRRGMVALHLKEYEKAITLLSKSINMDELKFGKEHYSLAMKSKSLGEAYLGNNEIDKALISFKRAKSIFERMNVEDEQVSFLLGKVNKQIKLLEK